MYLVTTAANDGPTRYLLFWADPRPHCSHPVTEGVEFIGLATQADEWRLGANAAPHFLARSKRFPLRFKAFRSEQDVPDSWEIVAGVSEVWTTWEAFKRQLVVAD